MAKAQLLCDASYNEDIYLGGYSGGFRIESEAGDWSNMYHGLAPDSANSNEAEMLAIATGAKRIRERLVAQGEALTELDIYTDSLTAMKQYKLYQDGRQHDDKYSLVISKMAEHLEPLVPANGLRFHHVKAHVDNKIATPLEAFHNMVDRNALTIRWEAQNHLYKPDLSNSQFYGIVLPAKVAPNQAHGMRQLAYTYARQGLKARVALIGKVPGEPGNHPFHQGLALAAKDMGVPVAALSELQGFRKGGGRTHGCEGLDRALVRHHYRAVGKYSHYVNFNLTPLQFAGVASRLMYGPQAEAFLNDTHLTGRKESASRFVINIYDTPTNNPRPTYTSEWVDTFTQYVGIPLHKGLDYALAQAATPPNWTLQDPGGALKEQVAELVTRYARVLEPAQFLNKVMVVMGEQGIQFPKEGRERMLTAMERFSRQPNRLVGALVNQVLRADQERGIEVESAPSAPKREVEKGEMANRLTLR